MDFHFTTSRNHRYLFQKIIEKTPLDLLAVIPDGFRNNIYWNIAHVVATQQLLIYGLSNTDFRVNRDWIDKFRKGTMPAEPPTESDIAQLSELLMQTVDWAQEDYKKGVFNAFNEYTTSTKVTIKSIEDAIAFNIFHEGYHLGAVVSLQKVLGIFPYR